MSNIIYIPTISFIFVIFLMLNCETLASNEKTKKDEGVKISKDEGVKISVPQNTKNCTNNTSNECKPNTEGNLPDTYFTQLYKNKSTLMRAFYVVLALTLIVVVYFVARSWRLRRHRNKSRKYGIITTPGADVEMQPLDDDDDDDDMTLFEMNGRPQHRK